MTRQTALLRSLALIASIAPSSYQAAIAPGGVNPGVSSRLNMTFYDPETNLETVIGYLEHSISKPLMITDVAHVSYSKGKYNLLLKDGVSEKKIKAKTPHSLKVQAMRRFGSEILKEYEKNCRRDGSPLYTWTRSHLKTAEWDVDYKVFSRRPEIDQPLRISAIRATLTREDGKSCAFIKPKFSVYRLHELLTRSEGVRRRFPDEHKWYLSERQFQAYSDYLVPPGSNVSFDTWPMTLKEVKRTQNYPEAYQIPHIVHWLTMGSIKANKTQQPKP